MVLGVSIAALLLIFSGGLQYMVHIWSEQEEYSHGWLIPPIALFLIWQRRDDIATVPFNGSWAGVVAVVLSVLFFFLGELSTLFTIIQYAFLVGLAGILLAMTGWRGFRLVWIAMFVLIFMVPLPTFLYANLSQKLQLISSEIGVWVIRQFGISVFLEGNVIDLGTYKLQVVEACSGLRYLFPLMTLGVIVAVFFNAPMWKRILVFVSTVPITVLMNSFRIGVIGVLVDRYGSEQAEGFLHDFEGWVIFMACFALLFLEMLVLTRLSGDRRPFRDIFALELPPPIAKDTKFAPRPVPMQAWVATVLLVLAVVPALMLPKRAEVIPARAAFAEFPMELGAWSGRPAEMERIYIDALKFTDYVMASYVKGGENGVNLYVAYYESQRKGESVHSPKSCLPGGGWVIKEFDQKTVDGVTVSGQPLRVNRTLITYGDQKQLVYYWFSQRGRVLTNEYLVKWFLFWDALTRNRSDGSLVRLITPVREGEDVAKADERLVDFAKVLAPELGRYVPD
ncbi:MAG: hypothetical protein NFCOHLIN_02953 [Gammaproteobacteria bacterium]|nr:hypothetical protein [Gammaproteobacteria bacterium]